MSRSWYRHGLERCEIMNNKKKDMCLNVCSALFVTTAVHELTFGY